MKLHIEWTKPVTLKDASRDNLIYKADIEKLPSVPGIYMFGRRWGPGQFEALYVGKANRIKGRVKGHFNNLRLMQHLKNASNGKRIILAGKIVTKARTAASEISEADRARVHTLLLVGGSRSGK